MLDEHTPGACQLSVEANASHSSLTYWADLTERIAHTHRNVHVCIHLHVFGRIHIHTLIYSVQYTHESKVQELHKFGTHKHTLAVNTNSIK